MKTAKDWVRTLSSSENMHDPACRCERCKGGTETFLLESDVAEIQAEAFKAGLSRAMELCQAVGLRHVTDMLRRERDKALAAELADPALKARIEEKVRQRLEKQ